MKHAYLILAHNEFDLLKNLIKVLDDPRNDIFIHFDRKLDAIPVLACNHANLYILSDRIEVFWGDVSVVEAEYALFEKAFQTQQYAYYHLLSGVDLPLKSQDDIHKFFRLHDGKEFIGYYQESKISLDRKVKRYHLFAHNLRPDGSLMSSIKRLLRALFLRFQILFGITRNKSVEFKKGTQWVSITHNLVKLLLEQKERILQMYKNTYCPDEIFIQTACWHSPYRANIFNIEDEALGCQRMIGWDNNVIKEWDDRDYEKLIASNMLFARKFSSRHQGVVERILQHITSSKG